MAHAHPEFPGRVRLRDRQIVDLHPGVVMVELAGHRGTLPAPQIRERVAQRRLPAVADMQRPGGPIQTTRVAAATFDTAAEITALRGDARDHRHRAPGDRNIDKTGAGDFVFSTHGDAFSAATTLRELTRLLLRLCELQRRST